MLSFFIIFLRAHSGLHDSVHYILYAPEKVNKLAIFSVQIKNLQNFFQKRYQIHCFCAILFLSNMLYYRVKYKNDLHRLR